jgi:hypothetical protein
VHIPGQMDIEASLPRAWPVATVGRDIAAGVMDAIAPPNRLLTTTWRFNNGTSESAPNPCHVVRFTSILLNRPLPCPGCSECPFRLETGEGR